MRYLFFIIFLFLFKINASFSAFATAPLAMDACINYLASSGKLPPYNCRDRFPTFLTIGVFNNSNFLGTNFYYSQQCNFSSSTYDQTSNKCLKLCSDGSSIDELLSCPVTCSPGQYKDAGGNCVAEPVCNFPLYNNNHVCSPIPDCNIGGGTGNFFNTTTNQCETVSPLVLCITGNTSDFYCPPIQDCKPQGYICSDNPTMVANGLADKAQAIANAQSQAQASADAASSAATQTDNLAAAAQAAVTQAQAAVNSAKDYLNNIMANPAATQADQSNAAQWYGEALNNLSAAQANQQAIQAGQQQAQGGNTQAQTGLASVPTSPTSGHAQQAADQSASGLASALAGLQTALNTLAGNGQNGSGQGVADDIAKGIQDGLAKEFTPHGTLDGYGHGTGAGNGIGHGGDGAGRDTDGDGECDVDCGTDTNGDGICDLNCAPVKGNFNQTIADAEQALVDARTELDAKMTDVKTSISSIVSGSITEGSGALPSIDFGTIKGVHLVWDLNTYAEELNIVALVILALAWLSAFSIIMGD